MMFDTVRKLFRGSGKGLICAVITPIGPGHAGFYAECKASVDQAWHSNRGPFAGFRHVAVDDGAGKLGRSRARNIGIERAAGLGADWLFFLDADDLMAPSAFADMRPYVADFDAVWGLIVGQSPTASEPHLRVPQVLTLGSFDELLLFDPFLTLQMGHFARASSAREVRFNEDMNVGEDFDYYLRMWESHRCAKVQKVFFINRHSRRSTGPKAATAEEWGAAVRSRLLEERRHHNLLAPSVRSIGLKNARIAELQDFCRQRELANSDNYVELSRQMPFRGHFDVTGYEGGSFVLYTNNDDLVCASLAWTGEYAPLSTALWQVLAKPANIILDTGAGNGFFGLLAARAAANAHIHCFEPRAENYARMCVNISLNGCKNIHPINAAAVDVEGIVPLEIFPGEGAAKSGAGNASRERQPLAGQAVNCMRIDAYVERNQIDHVSLVKVNIEGSEHAAVTGMQQTIARCRPDLLIEVVGDQSQARLSALLRQHGYHFYAVYDSRQEIEATAELVAGGGNRDLNRLASVREAGAVAQLAKQAYGRPLNFG
jgi:FkbM family methyltransferase